MVISKDSLVLLGNIAEISESLVFPEGKQGKGTKLVAKTKQDSILVTANIKETLTRRFAIYDLKEFLNTFSLFSVPDISLRGDFLVISSEDNNSKIRYTYTDEEMVTETPPEDRIEAMDKVFDSSNIVFTISESEMETIKKAVGILKVENFVVRSTEDGKKIEIAVLDITNPTSNMYTLCIGKNDTNTNFNIVFRSENLKLAKGSSYTVQVSPRGLTKFTNNDIELVYYISCEDSSSYGD